MDYSGFPDPVGFIAEKCQLSDRLASLPEIYRKGFLHNDDLKRLQELAVQGSVSVAAVARTLMREADLWRQIYEDQEPREYVLPDGRIVQNRAAIEQSPATRLLGGSNKLLQDIDRLQGELNRLRGQLRSEMQTSLSGYSVFISHASEDKEKVARPLAEMLVSMSIKVW